MKNAIYLVAAILLAGCAVPDTAPISVAKGRWHDYRDLSRELMMASVEKQSAPEAVKDKFASCVADFTVKSFTPDELARLDQYARGEITLSVGELKKLNQSSNDRQNGKPLSADSLDRLDTTCPNDVASFREYLTFPL